MWQVILALGLLQTPTGDYQLVAADEASFKLVQTSAIGWSGYGVRRFHVIEVMRDPSDPTAYQHIEIELDCRTRASAVVSVTGYDLDAFERFTTDRTIDPELTGFGDTSDMANYYRRVCDNDWNGTVPVESPLKLVDLVR